MAEGRRVCKIYSMKNKLSIVGVILFLFFSFRGFCQSDEPYENETLLLWNKENPIDITDFLAKPIANAEASKSSFAIATSVYGKVGDTLFLRVYCFFIKHSSWINEGVSKKTLKYEQYLFNLAEYYTRNIRRDIIQYNDGQDFILHLERCFENNVTSFTNQREKYTSEINNSKNQRALKKWIKKIDALMKESEQYSSVKATVVINNIVSQLSNYQDYWIEL
jgi:hypothetical protein